MTMHVMPSPVWDRFLSRGHPLQPREPALGYASRLAALNGVTLPTLLGDMRVGLKGLARGGRHELTSLVALRGLGEEGLQALARYTPRRDLSDTVYTVAGHRLLPGSVIPRSTRFCPHCIAGDLDEFDGPAPARPWQRLEWVIDHVRSCPHHGVSLLNLRGRQLSYEYFDFSQSVAQEVLPELDRLRASAVPAPGTAYGQWVVARLDGVRRRGHWLDEAPMHAALAFCEALGFSAINDPSARRKRTQAHDLARAAEEGFRIADAGPNAVPPILNQLVATHFQNTRGAVGNRSVYGEVYAVLSRTLGDPGFEPFRHVLREHAFGSLPIHPGTSFLGVPLQERRVHSRSSATASLSMSVIRLQRLIGRNGGVSKAASDLRSLRMPVEEFDSLVAGMEECISAREASTITGLNTKQLRDLADVGVLGVLPATKRHAGFRYRYRRSVVDDFMTTMFRDAVRVEGPSERRMSVDAVARHLWVASVDVVELIYRGQCQWVGRTGQGDLCKHLFVDADEVFAGLEMKRDSNLNEAETLAALPGLHRTSLGPLVGAGLLEYADGYNARGTRARRCFSRGSVEAFSARYASIGEIAAVMGRSVWIVTNILRRAGIKRLDLSIYNAKLYRREDVASYLTPGLASD